MYDPLYEAIPAFERESSFRVEIVEQLPHPELNAYVKRTFESGAADLDLLSTHTKYASSQAQWLTPLDGLLPSAMIDTLLPRPLELSRVDGHLLQIPRNLDVRLLHYRRDLFENTTHREAFFNRYGRPLEVPSTWTELVDVASFFTRQADNGSPSMSGFLFPGRDSGLFGTFYELLVGAGGSLFNSALHPTFDSDAGVWAAGLLSELYEKKRVTPRELPSWHYDEISQRFREGGAAMVADWPGSYHLYRNPETCKVADHVGLALLPAGPAGIRAAYAGCHSFAVPRNSRNKQGGLALLRFLTSFESQINEARQGAIPCCSNALDQVRNESAGHDTDARRWSLLAETERTMIIPPRFAAYSECEDVIWQAVQRAMLGTVSPEVAVRSAAADVQSIVEARASAVVTPAAES